MDWTSIRSAFETYDVILEPDENIPEWWAGAPSVVRDASGAFWLAARMREGNSPRGRRGYEVRILRSEDGVHFAHVNSIIREDVPIAGFERPAILIDPQTGLFRLYGCGPWGSGEHTRWCILKFDDVTDPTKFDPRTCQPVLEPSPLADQPRRNDVAGYKDPFIFHDGKVYHLFTIGYARMERCYHFTSEDGILWEPVGNGPAFDVAGWHNFFTRPACILPAGLGYFLIYEGSHSTWYDPVYNIATGLAYTADLRSFVDLTPDAPLLRSTTPGDYFTWRYSHWLWVGREIWAYAEVARPNNTNEIRRFRFSTLGDNISGRAI